MPHPAVDAVPLPRCRGAKRCPPRIDMMMPRRGGAGVAVRARMHVRLRVEWMQEAGGRVGGIGVRRSWCSTCRRRRRKRRERKRAEREFTTTVAQLVH